MHVHIAAAVCIHRPTYIQAYMKLHVLSILAALVHTRQYGTRLRAGPPDFIAMLLLEPQE